MKRLRVFLFFATLVTILAVALLLIKLAQGYRPDFSTGQLLPTGLLVATSTPDGAQLWIDNKLRSATNTTLNLPPGKYKVEIKKEGYSSWKKDLVIEKELVTKTDAYLFPTFPDLKALTYTGAANPFLSPDGQKVIFAVAGASVGKNGLWVLELADRPLGLPREPRQIVVTTTKGRDFSQAEYSWSPDSKQLLVSFKFKKTSENFLLDTDKSYPEADLINISQNLTTIKQGWQEEEKLRDQAQISKLPSQLLKAIDGKVAKITFAPDESKILYTATASATIPDKIVPPMPASNTQPESRKIEPGKIYVYDLKEDKNFYLMDVTKETSHPLPLSWFPTSKHLFLVQKDKISIIEYDDTNWVTAYSGPLENSFAFPFPDSNKILILTSIGKDTPPNLYAVSLR